VTRLSEIQSEFQRYLLGDSDTIAAMVRGNERIIAADLLQVYRRGYSLRLVEALGNDFPGLHGLLGPAAFAHMARAYVAAHPSQHSSLRWLGRNLPHHLATHPIPGQPFAADMAHFDWAVALAFDARDEVPATMADMLALPAAAWDSFRLLFTEAVSDFRADAGIADLRRAVLRAVDLPQIGAGGEQRWVVWRQDEDVQYRPLAEDEAAALDLMRNNGRFGAMCRLLAEQFGNPDAALRSAQILKDWLDRGLVAAIDHDAAASS